MSLSQSFGSKKDKKDETKESLRPSRVRLTWTNGAPTLHECRLLLAEAEKTRGVLCELPIKTSLGIFVLSCQSDHLSKEPCWTLYQGEDGTQQLWSYMNENVDMITDIVGMSVTTKDSKTEVRLPSGELAAPPVAAAPQPAPSPTPASLPPEPAADPYAGWGQPPAPAADPWGPTTSPAAPIDTPAQPGWGGQPTGHNTPAQGWGQQQPYSPQGYGAQPESPWTQQPAAAPAGTPNDLARYANSLDSKKGATIAELSMDPMLPPQCVDAALKVQEMILTGHFSEEVAWLVLKLAVLNNGELDDGVILRAKAEAAADPNDLARQAASILQHAGILTEMDIAKAERELAKHKNKFAAALLSSGKVDLLILEAAQDCQPFLAEGRMRQDQAIIALHYCQRSRAKLKDAIEELRIPLL